MAIQYTTTGIIITDDRDPARDPLVLPVGTLSADVAAAVLAYIGPPRDPNFDGFGLWLLTSPAVQQAYDRALAGNAITAASLPAAVLAAAGGETKHLRTTLLLLRRQGLLDAATLTAMLTKAQECNLPQEFLDALNG